MLYTVLLYQLSYRPNSWFLISSSKLSSTKISIKIYWEIYSKLHRIVQCLHILYTIQSCTIICLTSLLLPDVYSFFLIIYSSQSSINSFISTHLNCYTHIHIYALGSHQFLIRTVYIYMYIYNCWGLKHVKKKITHMFSILTWSSTFINKNEDHVYSTIK